MNTSKWLLAASIAVTVAVVWWFKRDADPQLVTDKFAAAAVPVEIPAMEKHAKVSVTTPTVTLTKTAAPIISKNIEEYVDWQRELIASLIVIGDADSLMAAALILHAFNGEDPGEQRKIVMLLDRAYRALPGDRAIASVALRVCGAMSECNATRYESAVRNIDARNALGYLSEILAKIEKGTPAQATEPLSILAGLRLNLYHAELAHRVSRAIANAPTSPRSAPTTEDLHQLQSELVLRAVGAVEVPSYIAVGPACQERQWRTKIACEAIVRDLGRGELIELQRLGMEIDASLTESRGKRPSEITDAEAYLNWMNIMRANSPPTAAQWLSLLGQHRTELAATRAWLESKGIVPPRIPRWLERSR